MASKTTAKKLPPEYIAKLSPPWYTLRNKIAYTIGKDPKVTVSELDTSVSPYIVRVTTDDAAKGSALATLLIDTFSFGGPKVDIRVQNSKGDPYIHVHVVSFEQLMDLANAAFEGNPLFFKVVKNYLPPYERVGIVFRAMIVQFWNDDLSDVYGDYNETVENTMDTLIKLNDWPNNFWIVLGTERIQ